MMQLAERRKTKLTDCLPICLSDYLCRLTFHTEFGAPAVFVDEDKKDEEQDTSEARQTHSDGNLSERRKKKSEMLCQTQAAIRGLRS